MAIAAPRPVDQTPAAPAARTRVAIAGATGYAGQELVRLLARHPAVTLTAAMSSGATSAPRPMPALARIWDGEVTPLSVDRLAAEADVVFLALPEAASAEIGTALLQRGVRAIDLSGAFRIRNDADRQRWYPATTALPAGVVYGLPERDADAIRDAKLVSCPGCYPTAALLALLPLGGRRPSRRLGRRRRQVGRLGRRQDAERAHPFLGEPRQRCGVRDLLAPAHGRDRAGARAAGDLRAAPGAARPRHP